jgi:F-type H+-transporting ATPase subunit gamma
MADRLSELVLQIRNTTQLEAVVTAMRGIAAARAQKSRSLLGGLKSFTEIVSVAIGQALDLLPADLPSPHRLHHKVGLVVFCAEQGFAGSFSERVLDVACRDNTFGVIFLVGTRGMAIASERKISHAWSAPMPSNIDLIPAFANRLADALYGYIAEEPLDRVEIAFSRTVADGRIVIDRHSVLPLDFSRFRRPIDGQPPLTTLSPETLLELLATEYVYAQLCEAAMHSFEAENTARMSAMTLAKSNIHTKLDLLRQQERQLRQEEITTEIVELTAGADAARIGT